jgi:hypothetical protein
LCFGVATDHDHCLARRVVPADGVDDPCHAKGDALHAAVELDPEMAADDGNLEEQRRQRYGSDG